MWPQSSKLMRFSMSTLLTRPGAPRPLAALVEDVRKGAILEKRDARRVVEIKGLDDDSRVRLVGLAVKHDLHHVAHAEVLHLDRRVGVKVRRRLHVVLDGPAIHPLAHLANLLELRPRRQKRRVRLDCILAVDHLHRGLAAARGVGRAPPRPMEAARRASSPSSSTPYIGSSSTSSVGSS